MQCVVQRNTLMGCIAVLWYSAEQWSVQVQYSAVQCSVRVQCSKVQYCGTIQLSSVQYSGTVQISVVCNSLGQWLLGGHSCTTATEDTTHKTQQTTHNSASWETQSWKKWKYIIFCSGHGILIPHKMVYFHTTTFWYTINQIWKRQFSLKILIWATLNLGKQNG